MSARIKRPKPSCPICGKAQDARYRPFCSKRCANIDLNRWLTGGYAIPAAEEEPGEEEKREEGAANGDEAGG
ncbi:MAG: DNA gyrase inhibitor YacG [Hyphomicrobiales bacterium]|nr:DNA gyrase inhibitor YacG [Hyphomicrobiales bacterium]